MLVEAIVLDDHATAGLGWDGIPIRRRAAPLVRRLQQICASMISEALAESTLVQLEFAVLVFVDYVPGIHQRMLSDAMGIDRNNVSLIVEGLEERGLLSRSPGVEDRRARQLFLTARGKELWRRLLPKVRAANQR